MTGLNNGTYEKKEGMRTVIARGEKKKNGLLSAVSQVRRAVFAVLHSALCMKYKETSLTATTRVTEKKINK